MNRRERGIAVYASQFGVSPEEAERLFVERYGKRMAEEAFHASGGGNWEADVLSLRDRSLIVVAALAAQGGVEERLRSHVRWALVNGATPEELDALVNLLAVYVGYPRASVAMEVVRDELAAVNNEKEAMMSESAGGGPNPLLIHANTEQEIGPGVFVIPDRRVNLVPNVGIVLGDDAVLVVDTGIGPANGELVRAEAQRLGGSRRMYVTLTHFHPEHGFGAQSFTGGAHLVYNRAQADELAANGQEFVELFTTFGPEVAELLAPVELVEPQETYEGRLELELGGRTVELREFGGAHTLGDQVVLLPEERIMFAGDLVENRFFPIVFGVANGPAWIETLAQLDGLEPTTVVPGHGEVGGPELIRDQRAYLIDVRDRVADAVERGEDADAAAAALGPEIRERYASWDNPEWIDFAIRDFHARAAG